MSASTRPTPERTRRSGVLAQPVAFSNGVAWGLACPTVRLRPQVATRLDALGRPSTTVEVATRVEYPPALARRVDAFRMACDHESTERQYETFFAMTAALLCAAHEIDLDTACSLLEVAPDDLPRLVCDVLAVISAGTPSVTDDAPGDP